MTKDYLAMRKVEGDDKLDSGVKGMKWGIRRSPAQLSAAKTGDSDSTEKSAGSETSQQRYTRLKQQASTKGANALGDDDLKFLNNRAEAIKKVAALNQQKPGWIANASKTVLQTTAQQSMQSISSALAKQYLTDPLIKSLGAKPPKSKTKK